MLRYVRPGWRKTSFPSNVQKLLGDAGNDLHHDAITSLATDCSTWRNLVVCYGEMRMMRMRMRMRRRRRRMWGSNFFKAECCETGQAVWKLDPTDFMMCILFLTYLAKFQPQLMRLAQGLPQFCPNWQNLPKRKNLRRNTDVSCKRENLNPNLSNPVNFIPFGTMRYSIFDINIMSLICI